MLPPPNAIGIKAGNKLMPTYRRNPGHRHGIVQGVRPHLKLPSPP